LQADMRRAGGEVAQALDHRDATNAEGKELVRSMILGKPCVAAEIRQLRLTARSRRAQFTPPVEAEIGDQSPRS
jgi:hypothetical protein